MAIYDYDADAVTAVTAWLLQHKVASTGDITDVSTTDTFHVYWIHRSLQKIAYDLAISGDDEINLSYPNPSKSEAIGTIITLNDHTTDFSVNYTVTDTVMESHFGGSVSQNGGDDIYSGLQILGKTDGTVDINILQNNVVLTSHWGTGKNSTDGNTLARLCIKSTNAGVIIDNNLVTVRLNKWLYEYAIWGTTLGLGEKVASVTSNADPQNTTASIAAIRALTVGTSSAYGWQDLDLDTTGDEPYICELDWGDGGTKKSIYEFHKAILCEDSSDTLYGVIGTLWTGRLFDCSFGSGTGTWVQDETITWADGTGHLVAVDDTDGTVATRLILHLDTGTLPLNTQTVTGAGSATGVLDANSTALDTSPNFTGTFTGSWIGAVGIGFVYAQATSSDSFKTLDGSTVKPPNNVPISGTVECVDAGDDPHVFLALKGAGTYPEYDTYSCAGGTSGDAFIDVDAIASDVPQTGYIGVLRTGQTTREYYEYTSWSGVRFTLSGTISGDITATDPAHVGIFYESAVGGGTSKTVSSSLIYNDTPIAVIGWVRQGDEAAPDLWQPISGTIGSGGFSFSITLARES